MRILDLDLDFFISGKIMGGSDSPNNRPQSRNLSPFSEKEVRNFLEKKCCLATECKIPGKIVQSHHELFFVWKKLIEDGRLTAPFDLIHVDAHFDFGVGDSSWKYIMSELLFLPPDQRMSPKVGGNDGLNFTNLLSFSMACRWLNSIRFILHELWSDDLPTLYMQEISLKNVFPSLRPRGNHSFTLQLKRICSSAFSEILDRRQIIRAMEDCGEPVVPTQLITKESFQFDDQFDYIFLAKSPGYTPVEADSLIPIFESYMKNINF